MYDKLINVENTEAALTELATAIANVKTKLTAENISSTKEAIAKAWQSDNSNSFQAKYDELITNLSEAMPHLDNYYNNINAVVGKIKGFDNTITYGE